MDGFHMKITINPSIVTSALIALAAMSALIIVCLTQVDHIVHNNLYNFGLRFSYRWATPYWIYSAVIIGLAWFNITGSVALTYHVFARRKRSSTSNEEVTQKISGEGKGQRMLSEYVEPAKEARFEATQEQIQKRARYDLPQLQLRKFDVRYPRDVVDSQC